MAAVPSIGRASLVEGHSVAPQAAATQGLYERHASKIQSYCHHQLGSREEAEDAVQTTFMNAFRALGRGVVPEAESAWLFKIAENVCLSRRRSSWRRGRIESPNDFEVIEEIVPGPSRQHDELIGIEDALASMPEQQRRAILLREWQGLSYREVAEELSVSQSAVETLIFRARRSLAQGLEQPDSIKPKRKSFRRALHALDLSAVLATIKTLLAGSAAVKATAAAVAVTAAAGTAATVTPQIEAKLAAKAKPTMTAAAPATAPTSDSGARVAFVDQSGSRSVVLTSDAVTANAAQRSGKQAAAGTIAAMKQRKHSVPGAPSVQRASAPLGAAPDVAVTADPVAAAAPSTVPAGAEPVHVAPAPAADAPRQPEETKRDEAKREQPSKEEAKPVERKAEPKQASAPPRTDEGKKEERNTGDTNTDEGKKDNGKKAERRSDERKEEREDANANGKGKVRGGDAITPPAQAPEPQAVVAAPEQAAATSVPERKKALGKGGDKKNTAPTEAAPGTAVAEETRSKEHGNDKSIRRDVAASSPAPAPAPAVAAAVPAAPPAVVPAAAPAVAPVVAAPSAAPEAKERDRDRDGERERERGSDNGNGDNGKRKGKGK